MLEIDALKLYGGAVLAVFPRIAAVFLLMPILPKTVPQYVLKAGLCLALTAYFYPVALTWSGIKELGEFEFVIYILKELAVGSLIGLGLGSVWWSVSTAGSIIDTVSGASSANMLDPVTHQEQGLYASFLGVLTSTLLLSLGIIQVAVSALIWSFKAIPVGGWEFASALPTLNFAVANMNNVFHWALMISAPFIVLTGLIDLAVGLMGRHVAQLASTNLSAGAKAIQCVLLMMIGLVAIMEFIASRLEEILPKLQALVP